MAALDVLSSVLSIRRSEKIRDAETPEDASRMLRGALMRAVQLQQTGNKRMQNNALNEIKQLRSDMVAGQVDAGMYTGEMVGVYGHVIDQIERMHSESSSTNDAVNDRLDAMRRALPSTDTLIGALMTANPLLGYGVKIIRDLNRSRKDAKVARIEKQKADAELVDSTEKQITKVFGALESQQKATGSLIDGATGADTAVSDLVTEQKSANAEEKKERKSRSLVYKPMLQEIQAELRLLRLNMGLVEAEIAIAEARPDHVVIDNVNALQPEPVKVDSPTGNVVPFARPDSSSTSESSAGAVKEEVDPMKVLAEKSHEAQIKQIKRLERIEDESHRTTTQLIKLDQEASNDDDLFVKAIDGVKGTIRKVAKENIKHIDKLERKRGKLSRMNGSPAAGIKKQGALKGTGISDKSEDNTASKTIFGALLGAFTFLKGLGALFAASGIGRMLIGLITPIMSAVGFLFKFGAAALKLGAKFLMIPAIIAAVFSFFDGFFNTEEIFGIASKDLSISDRIVAGLSNMAASMTAWVVNTLSWIAESLGFDSFKIDKDELAKKIYAWVQGIPDMVLSLFEQATSAIKAIMADIGAWFQQKIDGITEEVKKYVPDFMRSDDTPHSSEMYDPTAVMKDPSIITNAAAETNVKNAIPRPAVNPWESANLVPDQIKPEQKVWPTANLVPATNLKLVSDNTTRNGPADVAAQAIKEAGMNSVNTTNNVGAPTVVNAPVSNVTNNTSNSTTVGTGNTSNNEPKFRRTADRAYK